MVQMAGEIAFRTLPGWRIRARSFLTFGFLREHAVAVVLVLEVEHAAVLVLERAQLAALELTLVVPALYTVLPVHLVHVCSER